MLLNQSSYLTLTGERSRVLLVKISSLFLNKTSANFSVFTVHVVSLKSCSRWMQNCDFFRGEEITPKVHCIISPFLCLLCFYDDPTGLLATESFENVMHISYSIWFAVYFGHSPSTLCLLSYSSLNIFHFWFCRIQWRGMLSYSLIRKYSLDDESAVLLYLSSPAPQWVVCLFLRMNCWICWWNKYTFRFEVSI